MAWVVGIRQVTEVVVELPQERRGPIMERRERRIEDLPVAAVASMIARSTYDLPSHRGPGAGPCGTSAGKPCGGGWAMRWTTLYLVRPLAHYYATYVPPVRLGAKSVPRGRRVS